MSASSRRPSSAGLWLACLGGAVAWGVQEMASYALVVQACGNPAKAATASGSGSAPVFALLVTVAALLVSLTALSLARRSMTVPAASGRERASPDGEWDVRRYLAFGGALVGAIFFLLILFNGVALLLEPACTF